MEHDLSLQRADELKPPVATLRAMSDYAIATAPETVALRHLGAALTYREPGRAVAALAQRLAAVVAPAQVVALVLPNSIEFHIAYFAVLKVLAAPALLNPHCPTRPPLRSGSTAHPGRSRQKRNSPG
jgi:long-chain acyl-CoA synthetase